MIRFRPSLVSVMPTDSREVRVSLPGGGAIAGKFNPNPRNPNITGSELVAWIRSQVGEGRTKPARLRETGDGLEVLLSGRTLADVDEQRILPGPLVTRVRKFRSETDRSRLKRAFNAWERDSQLRAAMLGRWQHRCQVEDCPIADMLPPRLQAAVVELHHLTHISEGGSDDPLNLALLCAAHHRLIHLGGPSEVEDLAEGDVIIRLGGFALCVARDLQALL